jgi:hypothetical protein
MDNMFNLFFNQNSCQCQRDLVDKNETQPQVALVSCLLQYPRLQIGKAFHCLKNLMLHQFIDSDDVGRWEILRFAKSRSPRHS